MELFYIVLNITDFKKGIFSSKHIYMYSYLSCEGESIFLGCLVNRCWGKEGINSGSQAVKHKAHKCRIDKACSIQTPFEY